MIVRAWSLLLLTLLLLLSCSKESDTGPGEVRWDREICARCAMAISDQKFSAQIRGGRPDRKIGHYKFDDLGCAVIWLDKQSWKEDARTEIWVNDHRSGQWVNAQTAWYVQVNHTPMDYGLGAQSDYQEGALDFTQAREHIYKEEKRLNAHTGIAHTDPELVGDSQ